MIQSHPDSPELLVLFPGTRVPGSDGESLLRGACTIDPILCGERVVWINRDMPEREIRLAPRPGGPT